MIVITISPYLDGTCECTIGAHIREPVQQILTRDANIVKPEFAIVHSIQSHLMAYSETMILGGSLKTDQSRKMDFTHVFNTNTIANRPIFVPNTNDKCMNTVVGSFDDELSENNTPLGMNSYNPKQKKTSKCKKRMSMKARSDTNPNSWSNIYKIVRLDSK